MGSIIVLSVSSRPLPPQRLITQLNPLDSCHLCHESPSVIQFLNEQGFCSPCETRYHSWFLSCRRQAANILEVTKPMRGRGTVGTLTR